MRPWVMARFAQTLPDASSSKISRRGQTSRRLFALCVYARIARACLLPPLRGEEQGGPSYAMRGSGEFANLLGPRDPPPRPAPTRGGGGANASVPPDAAASKLDCPFSPFRVRTLA